MTLTEHYIDLRVLREQFGNEESVHAFLQTAVGYKYQRILWDGEVYHSTLYTRAEKSVSSSVAYRHLIPGSINHVIQYAEVEYYITLTGQPPSNDDEDTSSEEEITFIWAYVKCHKPLQSPDFLFEYQIVTQSGAKCFIPVTGISHKVLLIQPVRRLIVDNQAAEFVSMDWK